MLGHSRSRFVRNHDVLDESILSVFSRLLRYDVSRGYAKWVPGTLLGHDLEGRSILQRSSSRSADVSTPLAGIWHTGVVAFGREYWFGGKVGGEAHTRDLMNWDTGITLDLFIRPDRYSLTS